MKKLRVFASILAITLCVGLVSSCKTEETLPVQQQTSDAAPFGKDTTISMVVGSHPSWPYDENWPVWKYFREATGANLAVKAIPNTDLKTKISLMMASPEELPDLIYIDGKLLADTYAKSGALVAVDDYLSIMPNYTKFWNALPEEEREERLSQRRAADGKTYYPQVYGTDERQGIRAWMYRKDIFEKHGLQVPETMDELYQVCKELKNLYPDSYPLCMREGLRNLSVMGPQWRPYFCWDIFYDFENDTWCYGAAEPEMLEIVEYMKQMVAEGLTPPEFLTINVKTWEELMSTDRGFILPDFAVRVDNFNTPNRTQNPDYTLAAMVPPKAGTANATHFVNKYNVDPKGYMICNTGDQNRIENAVRLIDWMYSDEAAELLSWGKEGETYEVGEDGEKHYIRPSEGDIEGQYGIFTYGVYLRVDPKAARDIASQEQQAAIDIALNNTIERYNPALWLGLTDEEEQERDSYNDSIKTYTEEMLSKFILGQEPISKWDGFVAELKNLGIDALLDIYERAYNRVKDK